MIQLLTLGRVCVGFTVILSTFLFEIFHTEKLGKKEY